MYYISTKKSIFYSIKHDSHSDDETYCKVYVSCNNEL